MNIATHPHRHRLAALSIAALAVLAGCDAKAPVASTPVPAASDAPSIATSPAAAPAPSPAVAARVPPVPAPSVRPEPQFSGAERAYLPPPEAIYAEYRAPISQPVPVAVPWAPPPMYVEAIPPQPTPDSNWTGGYWVWHGNWVWAPGRWATPPRPHYHWVPPYYEHRQDRVVFVDGFWSAPNVSFVPPARGLVIALAVIGAGVAVGHAAQGPEGPFVPAPPGSRVGLIVPAPIGTAPAVVSRAPAIVAPGMRVTTNVENIARTTNNINQTTINNHNTTVVNNITNVTIEAPAAATANHEAVHVSVPAQPHLAAAQAPRVQPQEQARVQAPQVQPQPKAQPQPQPQPQAQPQQARIVEKPAVPDKAPPGREPRAAVATPAPLPPSSRMPNEAHTAPAMPQPAQTAAPAIAKPPIAAQAKPAEAHTPPQAAEKHPPPPPAPVKPEPKTQPAPPPKHPASAPDAKQEHEHKDAGRAKDAGRDEAAKRKDDAPR